jgi:hypothetical protein
MFSSDVLDSRCDNQYNNFPQSFGKSKVFLEHSYKTSVIKIISNTSQKGKYKIYNCRLIGVIRPERHIFEKIRNERLSSADSK